MNKALGSKLLYEIVFEEEHRSPQKLNYVIADFKIKAKTAFEDLYL